MREVGRSTTCKAIMGEVTPKGSVKFKGEEIAGKKAFEVANMGIGYVPENRDIFPGLTTRQNLILGLKPGQKDGTGRWSMQNMFASDAKAPGPTPSITRPLVRWSSNTIRLATIKGWW